MLHVDIYRDKEEKVCRYRASGHCSFDEKGKDIVCASASVLLQVAILGISEYCGVKPVIGISDGKLNCHIPEVSDLQKARDIQVILETMLIGLKEIEKQYPDNIKIKIRKKTK